MRQKLWCIGLLFLTILAGGNAVFADQDHRKTEDALDKMMREGWKPVAPGVLQRRTGERRIETYAIGTDGLRWAVREMENRLRFLESQYQAHSKDDLRKTIEEYRQEIATLRNDLLRAEAIDDEEVMAGTFEKSGCSVSFAAHATAAALTATQGVTATATAHFDNTCGWYVETHAEAYATATINGVVDYFSQTDGPKGSWSTTLSSSAVATMQGGPSCSSSSYSWARYAAGNIFLSASEYNSSCPLPPDPPAVTISGPTAVGFNSPTAACVLKSWTSTVSGGSSPYSYQWYEDGFPVGTGTSFSRWVCPSDQGGFELSLAVTGSNGLSGSDTHQVAVLVLNSGGGSTCGTMRCFESNY